MIINSENTILACCSNTSLCNYQDPIFSKDVYPPFHYSAVAVSYTLLELPMILFLVIATRNFIRSWKIRTEEVVKHAMGMNFMLAIYFILLAIYLIDGPIELIGNGNGLSYGLLQTIEGSSICLLQLCIISSAYIWTKLLMNFNKRWNSLKVKKYVSYFFVFDGIYVVGIFVLAICLFSGAYEATNLKYVSFLFLISSVVNGALFAITCFQMGLNLNEIYHFDQDKQKKVTMLKVFAILIGIFATIRVANDIYNFAHPDWQAHFYVYCYCNFKPWSAIYLSSYMLFADMLPGLLFLLMFSPDIKTKDVNNDNDGSLFEDSLNTSGLM